jgi:hypothetical protein
MHKPEREYQKMQNWTNPLQPPQPYQSSVGQFLPPLLPQSPTGQWSQPCQSPAQQSLRHKYTPEQVSLYFEPYPDRGPKIHELKQKRTKLYQQIAACVIACLVLVVLFLGSTQQGITNVGLFVFAGIIGIAFVIFHLVKNKLRLLNEELRQELAAQARETEYTRKVRPPNEREYDEWIDDISEEIYSNAPEKLRLHKHPDHKAWRKAIDNESYALQPEEPEKFGASLFLEGRIPVSNETNEKPPLFKKLTRDRLRIMHYSVYLFTAFFITEDHIAIYTNTVNLRDSTRDREEFKYGYHQHLSHWLLNVDTTVINVDADLQGQIAPKEIVYKESTLVLTFDSGRKIERNVSALHVGEPKPVTDIDNIRIKLTKAKPVTDIDNIHIKLTKALIDHIKSATRSAKEAEGIK